MDRRELYSLTGSFVRISAPGDDRVALFTVDSASGNVAVLRPCDRKAKEFASEREPGSDLVLSAAAPGGVLNGKLRVDRWSPAQRMLIVDNPGLVFSQRRQASRVRAEIPVEVYVPDPAEPAGVRMLTGETIDVSRGGCAFALTDHQLAEGVEVVLVLCIDHHPVVVVATVLGAHPDVEAANRCRFVRITPNDQRMLAVELGRLEGLIRPSAKPSLAAR
jgi:hypothetical protein